MGGKEVVKVDAIVGDGIEMGGGLQRISGEPRFVTGKRLQYHHYYIGFFGKRTVTADGTLVI